MASKRDLGVSYFLGLGLGLVVSLLGYFVLVDPAADLASVGTLTAIGFASSLPYVGYWLERSDLSDAEVWAVARWCAAGIAIPTLFVWGLMLAGVRPRLVVRFPHLLVNLVAAGAVVGTLLGLIRELRRQYARVDELNRRNRVLNQVMSHDIQNDVSVIDGYVERIAEQADGVDEELLAPVQRKSEEIIETSRIAQDVQRLDDETRRGPVDVVTLVSECLDSIRDTHPCAEITTDLPDQAWVDADALLRTAIDNIVENAIEHNDRSPEISVGIDVTDDQRVEITIADNGPGIPPKHRRVITADSIPSSPEKADLGLWLVRWVVESYDGSLTVEDSAPRGTTVSVEFPAASRPETTTSACTA